MGIFISYVFIEEIQIPGDDFITIMQLILKIPSAVTVKGGSDMGWQRWAYLDQRKKRKNYLGSVLKHVVKSLKQ